MLLCVGPECLIFGCVLLDTYWNQKEYSKCYELAKEMESYVDNIDKSNNDLKSNLFSSKGMVLLELIDTNVKKNTKIAMIEECEKALVAAVKYNSRNTEALQAFGTLSNEMKKPNEALKWYNAISPAYGI